MGKPFRGKNPTLQNLHNVLSNQNDYNTLATQVLTGAHHHNSSSKRLLLAPALQIKLNYINTSPSPTFIVILQPGNLLRFYKTMGKTNMLDVTHFQVYLSNTENNQDKVVIPSTILSFSLNPHKSHKMSQQFPKNDLILSYYG